MVALFGLGETAKSEPVPTGCDCSAWTRSRRPLPISAPTLTPCATAVAARNSFVAGCWFSSTAPAPEANGALKEVAEPAVEVLDREVVIMASPGAATQTIDFP